MADKTILERHYSANKVRIFKIDNKIFCKLRKLCCSIRARPIRFFWANTDDFHFSLPISEADIFSLFKLQLEGITVHFFFRPHKQKNIYTCYNSEKADCDSDKLRTSSAYFALLRQNIHFYEAKYTLWQGKIYLMRRQNIPYEAKYTLLELFCHQPNMIGWTSHITSLDSMTVSVHCDIYKWLSLIDT